MVALAEHSAALVHLITLLELKAKQPQIQELKLFVHKIVCKKMEEIMIELLESGLKFIIKQQNSKL